MTTYMWFMEQLLIAGWLGKDYDFMVSMVNNLTIPQRLYVLSVYTESTYGEPE